MALNDTPPAAHTGAAGHVPLDVDGYPVAPRELALEQVHMYVRHGERTPVGVRMSAPPASIPEHWMFCNTARRFRAAVAGRAAAGPLDSEGEDESLRLRRVVERRDGTPAIGECLLGELTDVGRESTYNFGRALRELYVQKLGFLPDTVHSNDEVYFRSTNMPRTIESLQQIIHGLYPMNKSAEDFTPLVRIRNGKDENLFGNTLACKRLEVLLVGFAQAAVAAWNPSLEPLDKKVSKYLQGPIRLDGKPRASGVLDTVRAAEAHGIPVPPEFKEKSVLDVIEKAVVQEWFADKTEEVRRLGMGPLLSDLASKMDRKAELGAQDPLRILVHSTHDTCLAGLCSTLDVYDEKWPAFAASVTFELFRERTDEAQRASVWQTLLTPFRRPPPIEHYVRVRYQNRNLPLPFCSEEGKHLPGAPEFCTLAAFRERVVELTPKDYEAECAPPSNRTSS
ncbi:phosphoglycerate mutase-like protein [Obba rivulosa]|uniref:Phosphoglycerate mutase-like protein n=1 Tax=Obba rivulosa TaxID=1052685 RepID=A0A8E2DQH1_9APHY|nr:phosphoglycerate mutase-like protein [Obba rivulosa]